MPTIFAEVRLGQTSPPKFCIYMGLSFPLAGNKLSYPQHRGGIARAGPPFDALALLCPLNLGLRYGLYFYAASQLIGWRRQQTTD